MNDVRAVEPIESPYSTTAGKRKRLAIVSTGDELCGIAAYTRALRRQLEDFEVEVLPLDQWLLRSQHDRLQKLADKHIRDYARGLRHFDCVNIQLEYGTLGRTPSQVVRRFRWLAEAAPALSVTFHTILDAETFDWPKFWAKLATLDLGGARQMRSGFRRRRTMARAVYDTIRQMGQRKPVRVVTHTRRDKRLLRDVHGIRNIHDHPLAYLTAEDRERLLATSSRTGFPLLRTLPAGAKLVGTFGFISPYKGFDTAIRALRYLPDDYHLVIVGAVHPEAIQGDRPIDPCVKRLLDEAYVDRTVLDGAASDTAGRGAEGTPSLSIALDANAHALLQEHPRSLAGRVHFAGAMGDSEFQQVMAVCDAVVFPYREVGQTSSGPISQALELGCRVLASRTKAFLQLAQYHPGEIEFFDIGNHLELAGRLRADPPRDCRARTLRYDAASNRDLYNRIHGIA